MVSEFRKKWIEAGATFFYLGDCPGAPGTLASLAGVFLAVGLAGHPWLYVSIFIVITAVGFAVSGPMEEITGKKDPGKVVIDEVSGVMIAFFLLPLSWPIFWSTFFLFRAFDMFKIPPMDRLEKSGGSTGIMMDDIVAGLYTNLTMHLAIVLSGTRISG